MRKFYKPLSVLLALSMCVSMIAPALAKDEWKNEGPKNNPEDSGYKIEDHTPYDPAEFEGVLDEQTPDKSDETIKAEDSSGAATDVVMDKIDQEAVDDTNKAAQDLLDAKDDAVKDEKGNDQIDAADKLADALDQIIDAVTEVPKEVEAEAATKDETVNDKDNNPVTNEGEEVKVLDVQIEEKDGGTQVPTVEVKVEVKKDEKGETVTEQKAINEFASEKATAVAAAKTEAETAATSAQNALTAAQTAVSSRDQAALDTAKNQAAQAFADANEAAKTAAETYAVAEKVVTDAQAAYNDAVAKLEAAGYKLEDIKGQLEAAQKAVTDAQDALKSAAAAKAEAEKQRDYALIYNSLAQTITGEYDETPENEADFLAETLAKVEGLSSSELDRETFDFLLKVFNDEINWDALTEEETKELQQKYEQAMNAYYMAEAHTILGGGNVIFNGQDADSARASYLKWLNSEQGKKLMEVYEEKKAEVEKWEKEEKDLDDYYPFKDWQDAETPLGSADLFYKMYFYTLQEGVNGKLGTYTNTLKPVKEGLEKYLEAEELLKKLEAGEDVSVKLKDKYGNSNMEFSCSSDKIVLGYEKYTPEDCEALGISWDALSATARAQIQERVKAEMASQLGQTYNKVFKEQDKITKQTLYDKLKVAEIGNGHKEFETFMKYMDLLQYELQFRQHDLAYGGAWDAYKDTVNGTDIADTMVDGYLMEIFYLREELGKQYGSNLHFNKDTKEWEGSTGNEALDAFVKGDMSNEAVAKAFLGLKGMMETALATPGAEEEASIYKTIKAHMELKKDEAKKAAKAAEDAVAAYEAAKEAADKAQARLEELLDNGNLSAIENAKNRLENAQNALAEAEANRDAALAAQQQAEADYTTAMRLAIADSGSGSGTGTTTGGTGTGGDGGDSGVSIEDQAVPLAGLVSRAEFLDYLWRHEGSPAADAPDFPDVPADHDFAQAIGWGQANRLVVGYPDGNFYPDETVTVQMVRIILGCFSDVFGTNAVAAADLTTLTGEDGDVVFNCAEVLAEFFGEEYVSAANGEDDIDVDVAA